MNKAQLTIMLLVKDEEEMLEECLKPLSWADEILVVLDDRSADRSEEIANKYATTVLKRRFDGFSSQSNYGIDQAKNDWILQIAADERISDKLREEVIYSVGKDDKTVAYSVPFDTYLLGRLFKHSNYGNERHILLFNRKFARYSSKEIHEELAIDGNVAYLQGKMAHLTHRTIDHLLQKIQSYSTLEAEHLLKVNTPKVTIWTLTYQTAKHFVYRYFYHQGFRDGMEGFMEAYLLSSYIFINYAKLWEIQRDMLKKGDQVNMDFTGERWIFQEGQDSLIQREHMARYDYACSLTKGKQVLDIASGSGFGAHLLKTKGQAAKVVGGDIDSQSVEYANKNYAAQDLLYVEADAQNMPFSDEQFEVVVSYETIEHLPDYEAYLKQISRVMTKDGVALISTPDKDNYGLYNLGKPNPYHVHEFTRQEFVDVLKKYFSQVELQGQCSIDKQQWQAMQSKDHAKQKLKAVDRFGVLKKTKSVAKKVLGKNSLPSIHDKLVADLEPLSTDKDYVYMVATCRK